MLKRNPRTKDLCLEELAVGEALFIPKADIVDLPTFRSSVHQWAKRRPITLSVHDNGDEIEIARTPDSVSRAMGRVAAATKRYSYRSE